MEAVDAITALAGYTADQWGMVTTAQSNAAGIDNMTLTRLVDSGFLDHVRRGVYATTAAPEDMLRAQKAVWLLLNPAVPAWQRGKLDDDGGVLSHSSAAAAHSVGDLRTDMIEFIVPRRRVTKHSDVRLRRGVLAEQDVAMVDGLPVTTVERTIADLLGDHIDGGHAGVMIYQALRRGQAGLDTLAARIGQYNRRYGVKGRNGIALIEELIAQTGRTLADATTSSRGSDRPLTYQETAALLRSLVPALSPDLAAHVSALVANAMPDVSGIRETVANLSGVTEMQRRLSGMVPPAVADSELHSRLAGLAHLTVEQRPERSAVPESSADESGADAEAVTRDRDAPQG
jgi:predicted transcriptional regulator of viral defense system